MNIPIVHIINACLQQQRLGEFAWRKLEHDYGITQFRHKYFKPSQSYWIVNKIKTDYLHKYYIHAKRWSMRKMSLSSQSANVYLTTLLVNFHEYLKRLRHNFHKMSKPQKIKYECNGDHNNPMHHKWYHIGAFNFTAHSKMGRYMFTIAVPNNNTIKIYDRHHIWCPSVGLLTVKDDLKHIKSHDIRMIKIKVRKNYSTDTQLVFNHKYKINRHKLEHMKVCGVDYNQHDNKILCLWDNVKNGRKGVVLKFNSKRYQKLEDLQKRINELYRENQHCLTNTKSIHYLTIMTRMNHIKAFQNNIVNQQYYDFAHWMFKHYDCVCMEKLDAKSMRLHGSGYQALKRKNINRRVATLKPYQLRIIFKNVAEKEHKEIIFVNAKYTTQTDYGTMNIQKHNVGVESWIHHHKKYYRDPNAAHNILDWSLHPMHHILYRLGKIKNIKNLISIY